MSNRNGLNLIKRSILENIYDLKGELDRLALEGRITPINERYKSLQIEASKHSASIELSYLDKPEKGRKKREFAKNLKSALEWGNKDYNGILTEDFITGLGNKIDPNLNFGGYRLIQPKLTTRNGLYFPPSPNKVEREMDYLFFENQCIDDPIEKAIHAHFHIARVHPLVDGNGRCARLSQNIMLEYEGFIPIVLKDNQREAYIDTISEASSSYRETRSLVETDFNSSYAALNHFLNCNSMNLSDINYPKGLCLSLIRQKTTPNKNNFYNYIAEILEESYKTELKRATSSPKFLRSKKNKRKTPSKKFRSSQNNN